MAQEEANRSPTCKQESRFTITTDRLKPAEKIPGASQRTLRLVARLTLNFLEAHAPKADGQVVLRGCILSRDVSNLLQVEEKRLSISEN